MKKILILSCALAIAGLSTSAMAAEGQGFLRAEIGQTDGDLDIDGLGTASDDDTSYSIRGGYWFNANFAVEAFYSNLYDKADGGDSFKLRSYGVGVVGKKNFGANNSGVFISGRAGIERAKGDLDLESFGISGSDSSNEPYFGVGAGYDFSESFGLSVNYDFHKADGEGASFDADTISVGAEVRF